MSYRVIFEQIANEDIEQREKDTFFAKINKQVYPRQNVSYEEANLKILAIKDTDLSEYYAVAYWPSHYIPTLWKWVNESKFTVQEQKNEELELIVNNLFTFYLTRTSNGNIEIMKKRNF